MKKPPLNKLGKILVVEEDEKKAEAFRQEFLGFPGNQVEVVNFHWQALIRLAGAPKYDFVLWQSRLVRQDMAKRMIGDDFRQIPDLFGAGVDHPGREAMQVW